MTTEPVLLDPVRVAARYRELLRPGASLESALERPARLVAYGGEQDPVVLAAGLLWGITRAHALLDGNKRASIVLADELLVANSLRLEGPEDDLYLLAYDAAAGTSDEAQVLERMRALVRPGAAANGFASRYPRVIERLAA